jgi:hypothetical protein
MKKWAVALTASVASGWFGAAWAISDTSMIPDSDVAQERAALNEVIHQSQQPHPDQAAMRRALKTILARSAFGALSEEEQHGAYLFYGAVLFDAEEWQDARTALRTASEMPEATGFDWDLRVRTDFRLHDYGDAAAAATRLAERWPEKLSEYTDAAVFRLARAAEDLPGTAHADFLEALYKNRWKPKNGFVTGDDLWLSLARIRTERGDVAGATAIAAEIRYPASILAMRIDKRFDGIVQAAPDKYDVMKAYDAFLRDQRAKSAAAPDKLEGVNAVSDLLLTLNRPDEALSLTSAALARLKENPKAYSDDKDQSNWTQDIRSRALFTLGRDGEGFAALLAGASQREDGGMNVSQAINLADMYNLYDKPKDALAAVASVGKTSDYGHMALLDARACAYFELQDSQNLAAVLSDMRAHRKDGARPFLNAMLLTGNLDDAAAEVITELQDPDRRIEMLRSLQDYAPDPHPTKRSQAVHAAWVGVRARPDVAAEIAKVGHIGQYPLQAPSY